VSRLFSWAMLFTSGFTAATGIVLAADAAAQPLCARDRRSAAADRYRHDHQQLVFAEGEGHRERIFLSSVKFGPAIVPPLAAVIVSYWGWREIFYAFAVPGILLAVVWYLLVPDRPSESRFCSQRELDIIADRAASDPAHHHAVTAISACSTASSSRAR
jgi:MFS transporter, ACS family, glucarate transporter